ncbi:NAD(P)-dependent alcohol dehydrogenase [Glutamicibacter sp. NPDC087344]|uniref:NAD(P)-dependent alcohol dehydrogenase n=1 Tax=Glutamicibacter sp. NPDC087344 TaxID=3363994 RepID=UPI00382BEEF9
MRAVVFDQWKTFPTIKEVPKPVPGPGEVLLKVAGAGVCHSDVAVYSEYSPEMGALSELLKPSYILGHENSGWVEAVGEGVIGVNPGEAYLVYGPIGCGRCKACSRGQDTYCEHPEQVGYLASGLGRDGGMAEYVKVPARNLVPLYDADPVAAAPLSDAGLTPYHAIKNSFDKLAGGGKTALVIGLGGLGQVAVQILLATTGAKVIATDMKSEAMELAASRGAVTVAGGENQTAEIRELTGGRGVDAVFDFVGVSPTIKLGMETVASRGRMTVVGIAGGPYTWSFYTAPYEAELVNTYWGTIEELHEVVALYRDGKITPDVELFSLDNALDAYQKLESGELSARAVVVPHM